MSAQSLSNGSMRRDFAASKNIFLQHYRQQQSLLRSEGEARALMETKERDRRQDLLHRIINHLVKGAPAGASPLRQIPFSPRDSTPTASPRMYDNSQDALVPPLPLHQLGGDYASPRWAPMDSSISHFLDDPLLSARYYKTTPLPPPFAQRLERLRWRGVMYSTDQVLAEESEERQLLEVRECHRRRMVEDFCTSYFKLILHDLVDAPDALTQLIAGMTPGTVVPVGPAPLAADRAAFALAEQTVMAGTTMGSTATSMAPTVQSSRRASVTLIRQASASFKQNKKFEPYSLPPEAFIEMVERKDRSALTEMGGIQGLALHLNTHLQHGIEQSTIVRRIDKYGINMLPPAEEVTFWGLVKEALEDQMMRVLMGAAVVSLILNLTVPDPVTGQIDWATGWIEGAAILVSVAVNVLVGAGNDYKKAEQFRLLNAVNEQKEVSVIRDGEKIGIDISRLVVGDILCIEGGDQMPADAILVDGQDVKCDESAATGESDTIDKIPDKDSFMISGTNVLEGIGRAIVVAVGPNSFSGKLTLAAREEKSDTPLQEKLGEMADQIGQYGTIAAVATVVLLSCKELFGIWVLGYPFVAKHFLEYIIVAITIVVVAIPEGLPLAVTIALAYSMKNMMSDNCLVRVLAACETMGGATAICSDKTGTLTTNKMSVVQGWIADRAFIVPGMGVETNPHQLVIGANNAQDFHMEGVSEDAIDLLMEALSFNTTAELRDTGKGEPIWVGNKTEFALLQFLKDRLQRDFMVIRNSVPQGDLRVYPFSSEKKHMTTLLRKDGKAILYCKGAPEMLLPQCTQYLNAEGFRTDLKEKKREYLKSVIADMAMQGNRTLLLSYAERDSDEFPAQEPQEDNLCLICLVGIQDPIRPEVPAAVAQCQKAGIIVRMVTGDNKQTAVSIAEKCGIYQHGHGIAMEGKEFRKMAAEKPAELRAILPKLQILARSSPSDKNVLVDVIHKVGEVVAVTGDGTNDAPALKMADVGFAMKSGTDIARNASDMIILDDNFVSVVKATMWGRNVNDNIRKFLQFQVTVNIVGVLLTFIGAAFSAANKSPLTSVQLLWLNLIMDTLAALALATEQPSEEVLNRPPRPKSAPLISRRMWLNIAGQGVFMLVSMLLLLNSGADYLGLEENGKTHLTLVFNAFIMMQIFNEFNARKLYNEVNVFSGMLTKSLGHLGITIIMVGFQFFAVQFAGDWMNTVPLSVELWLVSVLIGALTLPLSFLLRLIPVSEPDAATNPNLDIPDMLRKDSSKLKVAADQTVSTIRVAKALTEHKQDSASKVIRSRGSSIHMRKAAPLSAI